MTAADVRPWMFPEFNTQADSMDAESMYTDLQHELNSHEFERFSKHVHRLLSPPEFAEAMIRTEWDAVKRLTQTARSVAASSPFGIHTHGFDKVVLQASCNSLLRQCDTNVVSPHSDIVQ